MSVHRDRDGYRVRWREHGKQQSRNFPRRAEAIAFDAEVKRRGRLGTLAALTAPAVTLDAFVEHTWAPTYAAMLAPRTQRGYGCLYDTVISPTFGPIALTDITPELINQWQAAEVRAGRGRAQIRKAWTLLGGILQRAVEGRHLEGNQQRVSRKIKGAPPRRVVPVAPVGVEAMRRALLDRRTGSSEPLRDATIVSVLAYGGLRPGEVFGMRWRDVAERTLAVDAAKTGRSRTVRLLGPLKADLAQWRLASRRPPAGRLVFPGVDGGVWSEEAYKSWARRSFAQAATVAGVSATPYTLRHSFASLLAHEGRSVPYIAKQLGHGAELSLRTYQHVIDEFEDAPRLAAEDAIRAARDASTGPRLRNSGGTPE